MSSFWYSTSRTLLTNAFEVLFVAVPATLSSFITIASANVAFFRTETIRVFNSASVVFVVLILSLGNLGIVLMLGNTPSTISMV